MSLDGLSGYVHMIRPGLPKEAPVLGPPLQDERQSVGDDDDGRLLLGGGVLVVVAPRVGVSPVEQGVQGCVGGWTNNSKKLRIPIYIF